MINWLYYKEKIRQRWIKTKISVVYWNIILTLGWGLKIIPFSYCIKCQENIEGYISTVEPETFTKFDDIMMKWYLYLFNLGKSSKNKKDT